MMSVILRSIAISFNNKAFDVISVNYSQFYNFYACQPRRARYPRTGCYRNLAAKAPFQRAF